MEAEDIAGVGVFSVPLFPWFTRDECPVAIPLWGRREAGWWLLPVLLRRAALTAACAGIALLLVKWWRGRGKRRAQLDKTKPAVTISAVPGQRVSPQMTIIPTPVSPPRKKVPYEEEIEGQEITFFDEDDDSDGNNAILEEEIGTQREAMEFNLSFAEQCSHEDSDEGPLEEESGGAYSLKAEEEDDSDLVVSRTVITVLQ